MDGELLRAAQASSLDRVVAALANGAHPDASTDLDYTALCIASRNGETALVERLLASRASVDLAMSHGYTPLQLAKGAEVVRLLLEARASVMASDNVDGRNALELAGGRSNTTAPGPVGLIVAAVRRVRLT